MLGHFDVVKALLSVKGIDINAVNSRDDAGVNVRAQATYYTYCIAPGSSGVIERRDGRKIRTDEIRESYLNIVNALIATDDIDAVDCNGYTALMHAVRNGFVDLIKIILNAGADVKLRCHPPLQIDTQWNCNESIGKTAKQMAMD